MYPFTFIPPYKDYIWGGRNLERFGKILPQDGIVAESWEISCHPDGESIIANGKYATKSLSQIVKERPQEVLGKLLVERGIFEFPILIKLIDANDRLSVQVHPNDAYAKAIENYPYGKTEMWYILSCKEGAKLVYDVKKGVSKEHFSEAVKNNTLDQCLKSIDVSVGDVINIPAGVVHAIGDGIVLAEIQQNSNLTYRVYDYNRVDKDGKTRSLHIEKALEVIDFNSNERTDKVTGLTIRMGLNNRTLYVVNDYFVVELIHVEELIQENTFQNSFHAYFVTEGSCEILAQHHRLCVNAGQSFLIPASIGSYSLSGSCNALKSYTPEISTDVIIPLKNAGFSIPQILENIAGFSSQQKVNKK